MKLLLLGPVASPNKTTTIAFGYCLALDFDRQHNRQTDNILFSWNRGMLCLYGFIAGDHF